MANPLLVARQLRGGAAASNIGALGGVLTGSLPNPGLAPLAQEDFIWQSGAPANPPASITRLWTNAQGLLYEQLPNSAYYRLALAQGGLSIGLTTSPTTTSTSLVDLDGNGSSNLLLVSLNTVGGDLYCWLSVDMTCSAAAGLMSVALALDGGASVGQKGINSPNAAGYGVTATLFWRFTGVAAGTHNVRARWATNSGTATASGVARQLMVMEVLPSL